MRWYARVIMCSLRTHADHHHAKLAAEATADMSARFGGIRLSSPTKPMSHSTAVIDSSPLGAEVRMGAGARWGSQL
jgi:hypothetical protein